MVSVIAALIGNLIEHLDKALLGLLAPFIGPLFFPETDPIAALIYTYATLFLGTLARPFGALLFGWMADRKGRKQALLFSLLGMSVATFAMGCVPTYAHVGYAAPLLLALTRILQNLFAAGETNTAAVFLLESVSHRKPFFSSLFETSTLIGILLASAAVTFLSYQGTLFSHWRYLMIGASLLGIIGLWMRVHLVETLPQPSPPPLLIRPTLPLMALVFTSGFSCVTYGMAMPFMTAFLTIIAPLNVVELTTLNMLLLILDACLLPVFGYLALHVGQERLMKSSSLLCAGLAMPLFALLETPTLSHTLTVRITIVFLGVAFSASYRYWAKQLIPHYSCTMMGLGTALGHLLIEAPAPIICLWLYSVTGWTAAPGMYLMLSALCAYLAVKRMQSHVRTATPLVS